VGDRELECHGWGQLCCRRKGAGKLGLQEKSGWYIEGLLSFFDQHLTQNQMLENKKFFIFCF
jgi:hypothetical protein